MRRLQTSRVSAKVESLEGRRLLASVLTVLNNNDSGAGSLRAAIAAAADGDTIDFAPTVTGEISLLTELTIGDDITITGPGAGLLNLSGGGATRVLSIAAGANVTVSDLSVLNGGGVDFGGGIRNAGTLTLNRVEVSGNQANSYGGGIFNDNGSITLTGCSVSGNSVVADLMAGQSVGGGFASYSNGGTISITNCTFADNAAVFDTTAGSFFMGLDARGGGLSFEGNSTITITNTTVTANIANSYSGDEDGSMGGMQDAEGGGIVFFDTGSITITNCTIADNKAGSFSGDGDTPDNGSSASSYGGGLYVHGLGTVSVTNTIIAGNNATDAPDVFNYADNSAFVNNLIGDGSGSDGITDNIDGNLVGSGQFKINAKLAALAANGGPTLTRALLSGSPAIDAGTINGAPSADQRGAARTAVPDIGAYEAGALNAAPHITSVPPTTATSGQPFTYSVTTNDSDGDDVTISASNLPAWLTLTDHGDGTATLTGTPTNGAAGANDVKLVVADGVDSTEQNFTISVTPVNNAPTLPALPASTAVAGAPFNLLLTGVDSDGDLLSFAVVSKPDWLIVTDNANNTATLSGTPGAIDGGLNQLVIQVSDGEFAAQQVVDINVLVPRWTFDNGVLGINGDALDNSIQVFPIGGNTLRVVRDGVIKNFNLADVNAVEIYGYDGADSISVNTRTIPAYVLGGAGNDTLAGGDEPDNFVGGGGKDFLDARGGNDRLDGGNGNDVLWGGDGEDRLLGGDGNDKLVGGVGLDDLRGEAGDDQLYTRGDGQVDTLLGGDGEDASESDWMLDFHTDTLTPIVTVAIALS